ncbi:MAG: AAA family ATPase [Thermoflexales bacterium]|nr:AAA family ATPase [Thermoflexales bacterium]
MKTIDEERKVYVHLAGTVLERTLQMYTQGFSTNNRFHVVGMSSDWNALTTHFPNDGSEILLMEADVAPNHDQLVKWLQKMPVPVLVILPQAWAQVEGRIRACPPVRDVFLGPHVNFVEVAERVKTTAVSERALRLYTEPDRALAASGGPRGMTVVGTRIVAVWGKGGAGKSTLVSNLGYELAHRGIRTICIGLDVPDAMAVYLDLKAERTSMTFFQHPGLEGFRSSILRKGNLDVVLSPNDALRAEEIARKPPEDPGSIRSLVVTAAGDGYAAVLLDLPAERTEWAIQPLIAANMVLLVAQPSFIDQVRTVDLYRTLTETLAGQHRIPPESIHLVMNETSPDDNLLPRDFQRAAQDFLQRPFPPAIALLPLDKCVRLAQNKGQLPTQELDGFAKGIRSLANTLFPGVTTTPLAQPAQTGLKQLTDFVFGVKR